MPMQGCTTFAACLCGGLHCGKFAPGSSSGVDRARLNRRRPWPGVVRLAGWLFGLWLGIASLGQAEEIRDYYAEPGLNPFKEDPTFLNETIDPFGGTLQHRYVDLEIPGNGGLDIVIQRVYTSRQADLGPRNPLGIGWHLHFGRIVVPTAFHERICRQSLYSVSTQDNPSIEFPDGRRELLMVNDLDAAGELVTRSHWKADCAPGEAGLRVTSPDGVVYTMDTLGIAREEVEGRIVEHYSWYTSRIEDLNGNSIEIAYLPHDGEVLIDRVSASDGRLVEFVYEGLGTEAVRLASITANKQTIRYRHRALDGLPGYWFLTRVRRPDGAAWRYAYYRRDAGDTQGAARYSLKRVTYPYGGTIAYEYASVRFDQLTPTSLETTVVASKTTGGPGVTPGHWMYDYQPSSGPGVLDRTLISTPSGLEEYWHVGLNTGSEVWAIGLLERKGVYEKDGSLLDLVVNTWESRRLSNENWTHGRNRVDTESYAPVLSRAVHWRGGVALERRYADFDIYGNPGALVETCNLAGCAPRETRFTYFTDLTKGIIARLEDEEIVGFGTIDRSFDELGRLKSISNYGVLTQYEYTLEGDLALETDARGFRHRYLNYRRGLPRRERRQIDESTWVKISRRISASGAVRSVTDGRGFTTGYRYDKEQRLVGIDYPLNADVTIEYLREDKFRRRRTLTRGPYRQTEVYDGFGRVVDEMREDKASGKRILVTNRYDALGRRVFESYPNAEEGTNWEYDALGRVVGMIHADESRASTEYGAFLPVMAEPGTPIYKADTRVTDEEGAVRYALTQYYGTFDHPVGQALLVTERNITEFRRGPTGLLEEVTQGEFDAATGTILDPVTRSYGYDERHFLITKTEPETGVTVFGRDPVGNKISTAVGGALPTYFVYDGLNRLIRIDYSEDAPDVSLRYDYNGNLLAVENGIGDWRYVYDGNDNLVEERLTLRRDGDHVLVLVHAYDELDHVASTTYPDGLEVSYAPDAFGRPRQANGFVSYAAYHPDGQLAELRLANGVTQSYALDERLRLARATAGSSGDEILDLNYDYDAVGNLVSRVDGNNASNNLDLAYDPLGRLSSAAGPWGTAAYRYNAHGDIVEKDFGSTRYYYHYAQASRRLLDISTWSTPRNQLSYDVRGNMTRDQAGVQYHFNSASELVSVDLEQAGSAAYVFYYDGNGRRLAEIDLAAKTKRHSLYDKSGRLLWEMDSAQCRSSSYVYLGTRMIARRDLREGDLGGCLLTPQHADSDGDGMSDAWEFDNGLHPGVADAQGDLDADGLANLTEYGFGSSAALRDTDADGMPDPFEFNYGLDPAMHDASGDLDGDGASNYQEFLAGTDPSDPFERPAYGLLRVDFLPVPFIDWFGPWEIGRIPTLTKHGLLLGANDFISDGSHWFGPQRVEDGALALNRSFWPIRSRGLVFSVDEDGYIYDFDHGSFRKLRPDWREVWDAPNDALLEQAWFGGVGENRLYDLYRDWSGLVWLRARSKATGAVVWQIELGTWQPDEHLGPSVGANDVVYVPKGTPAGDSLAAYDRDGRELWELTLDGSPNQPAIGFDGMLYVSTVTVIYDATDQVADRQPGHLYAITPDGVVSWTLPLSGVPEPVSIGEEDTLLVAQDGPALSAYSRDGALLWTFAPAGLVGSFYQPVVGDDGAAYLVHGTPDEHEPGHETLSVFAVSHAGVELWRDASLEGSYAPSFSALRAPVLTDDGTLIFWAVDARDIWSQTGRVFSFLTASNGMAESAWPGALGDDMRRSRIRTCREGDKDTNGLSDCAQRHRPFPTVPEISISSPMVGTFRQSVVKASTHVLDFGMTCSMVSNRFFQLKTLRRPDLPCDETDDGPGALPAHFMSPVFYVGDVVALGARAGDPQDGDVSSAIRWRSDQDGPLGTGMALNVVLSEGPHLITAEVTDRDGNSARDTQFVYVKGRPSLALAYLDPGATVLVNQRVRYGFTAEDAVTEPELAASTAVNWYDWRNEIEPLRPGYHRMTATTYDAFWDATSTTFSLTAVGQLTAVLNLGGSSYSAGQSVPLSAGYTYPSGIKADDVSFKWYSDRMGFLGEGDTLNIGMNMGTHVVTVEVNDSLGQRSTASSTVVIEDDTAD